MVVTSLEFLCNWRENFSFIYVTNQMNYLRLVWKGNWQGKSKISNVNNKYNLKFGYKWLSDGARSVI